MNSDIIVHGENGLLAGTEAEWEQALESLLVNASLRSSLAVKARTTVESGYSAAVQAPRVAALFAEAVG